MTQDRAKILERLRRLMSMTAENGASETEAIAAAEASRRLMTEHNLTFGFVEDLAIHNKGGA